jgi:hypothetical protein
MSRFVRALLLTAISAIAGSWIGTTILIERWQNDTLLWQAPLLFTISGAALITLAYARLRERRPYSPVLYLLMMTLGSLAGAIMLLWGGTAFAATGGAFGLLTASVWSLTHLHSLRPIALLGLPKFRSF